MRTVPSANFAALLIAIGASSPTLARTEEQAEQSAEPALESAVQAASAEENAAQDPSVTQGQEVWLEEPASGTSAAGAEEERLGLSGRVPETAVSSATPAAAPTGAPALPPVTLESPLELSRRIRQARQLAAEQRKTRTIDVVPDGLSREELELRGGERNVAIYDKQIAMGEGTPAIEAYRRYALQTLSDGRRRHFSRVWGGTLHHAEAPRLLREHAQRMAQLKRIRLLAEIKNFSGIVRQTEELMAKQTQRFEASMHALQGGTAASSNGSAPNVAQTAASR